MFSSGLNELIARASNRPAALIRNCMISSPAFFDSVASIWSNNVTETRLYASDPKSKSTPPTTSVYSRERRNRRDIKEFRGARNPHRVQCGSGAIRYPLPVFDVSTGYIHPTHWIRRRNHTPKPGQRSFHGSIPGADAVGTVPEGRIPWQLRRFVCSSGSPGGWTYPATGQGRIIPAPVPSGFGAATP